MERLLDHIKVAQTRIQDTLFETPLNYGTLLSRELNLQVYCKWENRHVTGSFKERGACNFLKQLSPEDQEKGVIASSAGNHALALSYHASKLNIDCKIVMPRFAPLVKVQATRGYGAEVILAGDNFDQAGDHASELEQKEARIRVHAFDHPAIVAGQGTLGLELMEQLPDVSMVVVPVGGGGLISGVATAVKAIKPDTHIVGVQSEWALQAHKYANQRIPNASIADGIAVKTLGKLTKPIVEQQVDTLVSVSESEVASAIVKLLEIEHRVVEGAGAAGIAAAFAGKLPSCNGKVAFVMCGSNIDINVLSRLIDRSYAREERLMKITASVPDVPGALHLVTQIISEQNGNIINVLHDRSFSKLPAYVDIDILLEVKDKKHQETMITALEKEGLTIRWH